MRSKLEWQLPKLGQDYSDEWFAHQFGQLWEQTRSFCEASFGAPGDNDEFEWTWYDDLSPEFCQLVEMVAVGDTATSEWKACSILPNSACVWSRRC